MELQCKDYANISHMVGGRSQIQYIGGVFFFEFQSMTSDFK